MDFIPMRSAVRKKRKGKPRAGRLNKKDLASLREACYERDMGICQDCGAMVIFHAPHEWDNSYHMAHIKAKRIGGDSLSNTKTKCGKCHRAEHSGGKVVPSKTAV